MDINIEKMLKLYVYVQVCVKTAQQKKDFFNKYLQFRNTSLKNNSIHPIQIQAL
jgi:hypothetical protein